MFYFYDILHGLRAVSALGFEGDERTRDARDLLMSKRLPDGTWPMEASFLRALRRNFVKDPATGQWHETKDPTVEVSKIYSSGGKVADIPNVYAGLGEVGRANPWITLNTLRLLKDED